MVTPDNLIRVLFEIPWKDRRGRRVRPGLQRLAAIDQPVHPRDMARLVRGQKRDGGSDMGLSFTTILDQSRQSLRAGVLKHGQDAWRAFVTHGILVY